MVERFRIHGIDDLANPDLCLAYPHRKYPGEAAIPASKIGTILHRFRRLRYMDETIYLRSGMLNVFNGMVGLTFSCDGSHYMPWDEFLERDIGFWVGDDAGSGLAAGLMLTAAQCSSSVFQPPSSPEQGGRVQAVER
mgnify:FL=1